MYSMIEHDWIVQDYKCTLVVLYGWLMGKKTAEPVHVGLV